ncbi:hypothetical protein D3C83_110450 [compost metagenome]
MIPTGNIASITSNDPTSNSTIALIASNTVAMGEIVYTRDPLTRSTSSIWSMLGAKQ